jgi:putative endopeptidase
MKKSACILLGLLLPAVIFLSCKHPAAETKPDILVDDIDTSVSAAQDFFLFANGGWIKKTPIPDAEAGWGVGNLVQNDIYARLKKINEDAENANPPQGSITQKIGDFWYSGMDTADIEKNGLDPLRPEMDMIGALKSKDDLANAAGFFHSVGINVLFDDEAAQDAKNSELMVYQLWQGGLGMPNRDYYFNTDEKTENVRKAYTESIFRTFQKFGLDSLLAEKKSMAVFRLETNLAKASRKLADLRDPYANYHKMNLSALEKMTPEFKWTSFTKKVGISKLDSVIVGQPEFFTALSNEIRTASLEDWKDYLRFHLILASASYLDSQTVKIFFDYRKALTGATKQRDRWKKVLDAEEQAIGEALGQLFVREFFSEKTKQRYADLIESVREAYKDRIGKLTWMTDSTKQKAYAKLAGMKKKVGYPDKWKDFSALIIDRGPFVLNVQRANLWWNNYNLNKLGKPVDRTEWGMTPQTYNAYYDPSNNEIVMPAAAFIIPGMRDEELDDAFVYGYAAANWIGHEMTHGFDDQGRQFDLNGNLKGWWQKQDSVQFVQRAQKIIRQFNEFNPVDSLHVNGSATQGENIADLGGLLIGLDAFRKTETFRNGKKIGGFTPLQRYFLGYAYGWKFEMRKEVLAEALMTDVHAPPKERVNGPVVNIPEFYEAFDVKPGDKMYRPDSLRVNIW